MTSVLTNRSAADRPATDFYPTPPDATVALLNWLERRELLAADHRIWEPACGQGHMAKVFAERGYDVDATDLFDDSYGTGGVDFLSADDRDVDWVITNPPFKLAIDFADRIIDLNVGGALLLKSQFWHAASRRSHFWASPPAAVLPLTWRPDFLMGAKGSSPTMDVLWTVWLPKHSGPTEYEPLPRPNGAAR